MKGFIAKSSIAVCLTAWMTGLGACEGLREVIDPCWPERYNSLSRRELNQAFAPQVHNGHVLDQTVWNTFFEPGTDRLTPGGMAHLAYIVRRRPTPDPVVYLQLAQDVAVPFEPGAPGQFVRARNQLDSQRVQAVQNYLSAYSAGRGLSFTVVVHDPPEVGQGGIPANVAVQKMQLSPDGVLRIYGGIRSGGGGG